MNEVLKFVDDEETMSVEDIANAWGISKQALRVRIAQLFPGLMQHGKKTLLNEEQVTKLSMSLKQNGKMENRQYILSPKNNLKTDLEMQIQLTECMQWLQYKVETLQKENELLRARVNEADSFRTVDRYIRENGIDLNWCEAMGLGKGLIGVGLKLSKWFKDLPADMQIGKITSVNIGKYEQKVYHTDILDAYFDVE